LYYHRNVFKFQLIYIQNALTLISNNFEDTKVGNQNLYIDEVQTAQ
jgi:hypothetical protein